MYIQSSRHTYVFPVPFTVGNKRTATEQTAEAYVASTEFTDRQTLHLLKSKGKVLHISHKLTTQEQHVSEQRYQTQKSRVSITPINCVYITCSRTRDTPSMWIIGL